MKHKSTTDYRHFLEDLAGMYPFSIEEAVLVETIANCLDARAGVIKICTDKAAMTFAIGDDGKGMDRQEFENYHNFSMTFKEKGKGIGFAGLGAKLALSIADRIVTETGSAKRRRASAWEFKGKEPVWEDIKPSGSGKAGTVVRIYLKDSNSFLIDPEKIRSLILKHYLPLFLFADFYKLAGVYPTGITFVLNDSVILPPAVAAEREIPRDFLFRGKKRKPFGIYRFTMAMDAMPDESQGIGISCFGKIINTEQREYFKQYPKCPEKITGMIEVPELVFCLTTSKTAFRKEGWLSKKYYDFYKIAQYHLIKWLEEIGQKEKKGAAIMDAAVAKDLIKLVGQIIADIPELHTLFGAKQVRDVLLSAPEGLETGTAVKEPPSDVVVNYETEHKKQDAELKTSTSGGGSPIDYGTGQPAVKKPRSIKFGPAISFANDEARNEISWTEGLEKVIINTAHPACKTAAAKGMLQYHYVIAVGIALIKELPPDYDRMAILNKYLTNWGSL